MDKQDYAELYQFFAGHFHQFWKDELRRRGEEPNFESMVNLYLKEASAEKAARSAQLLEEIINQRLDEDELSDVIFRKLGAWIRPAGFGMANQEWLEAVLKILQEGETGDSPERKHY